jgi:hypothetical protein
LASAARHYNNRYGSTHAFPLAAILEGIETLVSTFAVAEYMPIIGIGKTKYITAE